MFIWKAHRQYVSGPPCLSTFLIRTLKGKQDMKGRITESDLIFTIQMRHKKRVRY